ncbi:MAG: hypothetical protein JO077_01610 [Verrucomicrobia bacterium]|nr:hypothetical protein [Verrucomicrobiota bacterium]
MTRIADELEKKLSTWPRETAAEVERLITDIIQWTDADALDLMRSRRVEQEVLDLLDED